MDNVPTKKCNGLCDRMLPVTTEYWHRKKDGRDGFSAKCKECYSAIVKEYNTRPEIQAQRAEKNKEYRSRPEVIDRNKKGYKLDRHKRYHERPEIKKKEIAYRREYNKRPEVIEKSQTPEFKEHHRIRTINYRARQRDVGGSHTVKQIQDQLQRQKFRCYYAACGYAKFEKKNGKYVYHIDHTFPLSRTSDIGVKANDITYLVLACPSCNTSKNDKFPWEWPEGGRLL